MHRRQVGLRRGTSRARLRPISGCPSRQRTQVAKASRSSGCAGNIDPDSRPASRFATVCTQPIASRMWAAAEGMSKLRSDQPPAPSLERAYRDAYTALRSLVDDPTTRTRPADDPFVDDLVGEFERVAREARTIWTRELGPRMSWQAPFLGRDCDWELRTHCIDLDSGGRGDDQDAFSTNELALGFEDSVLDMAARAYRRECKWDFSPSDGGVWLIVLRPTSWSGPEEHEERRSASGNLVGFLILHDRDEDGEYEFGSAHLDGCTLAATRNRHPSARAGARTLSSRRDRRTANRAWSRVGQCTRGPPRLHIATATHAHAPALDGIRRREGVATASRALAHAGGGNRRRGKSQPN
jgi:hypothetical protein